MSIKNFLCASCGEAERGSRLRRAVRLARHHNEWRTGTLRQEHPLLECRLKAQIPDGTIEAVHIADEKKITKVTMMTVGSKPFSDQENHAFQF